MNASRFLFSIGMVMSAVEILMAAPQPKKVVAIDEFDPVDGSGATKENVALLRSYITDGVINCRKFSLVERDELKKLAKEQALADAGATEDGPESNNLKAAKYLVYGKILKSYVKDLSRDGYNVRKGTVELQIRFTNAETGKMLGVKTVEATDVKGVVGGGDGTQLGKESNDVALKKAAYDVVNLLVDLAYPTKILDVDTDEGILMVNMTMEQCKQGEEFDVFKLGCELVDPDTGESLGRSEKNVGKVVVSRPGPKMSECKVVAGSDISKLGVGMILRKVRTSAQPRQKPSLGLR